MRRDRIVDGIVYGKATVSGTDATDSMISMYESLNRNDVNCILLDGLIISMYNIVDGEFLAAKTGIPLVALSFRKSDGLEEILRARFEDWESRLERYARLGEREQVTLATGKDVFARCWGIETKPAISILNAFTLQGTLPEPIRIAKIAARAMSHALK